MPDLVALPEPPWEEVGALVVPVAPLVAEAVWFLL